MKFRPERSEGSMSNALKMTPEEFARRMFEAGQDYSPEDTEFMGAMLSVINWLWEMTDDRKEWSPWIEKLAEELWERYKKELPPEELVGLE
jgi:hypothetical protein